MCGLTGIVDFAGRPVERAIIERMRRCLHHRGPDDQREAMVSSALGAPSLSAGLGFCRLAILDLSPLGGQPMTSADGRVTLVFNGEIYNFRELRRELEAEGILFRSRGDTEVLVELIARRWAEGVPRLRGMFAFVAVDAHAGRVMLVRDRLGKKPLYYRYADGRLWFGSELKSLLADPELPREIDATALHHYLRYQYVPSPLTIFRDVRKVQPAHLVECARDSCVTRRYWELAYEPKTGTTFAEAVPEVRRLVEEAVHIRLESDVPLGAFLSGGVDSSVVTSVMSRAATHRVQTFSIGFDEARYDERPFARQIARLFDTEHHEFVVRMDAAATLPQLAWAYDEPFADSSALPTYHVSRLTREHVTVALSGDGGDEAFGGYERYSANVLASRLAPVVALPGVGALGDALFSRNQPPQSRTIARAVARLWAGMRVPNAAERYATWMTGIDPGVIARLFPAGVAGAPCVEKYLVGAYTQGSPHAEEFDRMQRLDVLTYLPEDLLVKVDRASMANSLEVRAPLLDHTLLEFVARLPVRIRNPRLRLKALLKAAFPEIPAAILERRKTGFGVPVAAWFRNALGSEYEDTVLKAGSRAGSWFDRSIARDLLDQHRSGAADHSTALWTLLMFEHWHRAHLG
jgi:asparagine synthase (glutamine-hydrolysing)